MTAWQSSGSLRASKPSATASPTPLRYGLAERAVALGWPAARVMVIDEDLG